MILKILEYIVAVGIICYILVSVFKWVYHKIFRPNSSEWYKIEGELCKIIEFSPIATIGNGEVVAFDMTTPYASVVFECKKLPNLTKGYIYHKIDFMNLSDAFKERNVERGEEVIFVWSKKYYKRGVKQFSDFMPSMCFMLCRKEAFELLTNPNAKPELTGEARFNAEKPIKEWKPEVWET